MEEETTEEVEVKIHSRLSSMEKILVSVLIFITKKPKKVSSAHKMEKQWLNVFTYTDIEEKLVRLRVLYFRNPQHYH